MNHTKLKKEASDLRRGIIIMIASARNTGSNANLLENKLDASIMDALEKWYKLGYKDAEAKGGKK